MKNAPQFPRAFGPFFSRVKKRTQNSRQSSLHKIKKVSRTAGAQGVTTSVRVVEHSCDLASAMGNP